MLPNENSRNQKGPPSIDSNKMLNLKLTNPNVQYVNIQNTFQNPNPSLMSNSLNLLNLLASRNSYPMTTAPIQTINQQQLGFFLNQNSFGQLQQTSIPFNTFGSIGTNPLFLPFKHELGSQPFQNIHIIPQNYSVNNLLKINVKNEDNSTNHFTQGMTSREQSERKNVITTKVEYEPTLQTIQANKFSELPSLTQADFNKMTAELDLSVKEEEPALAILTRNFPEWSLGEILDLFLQYSPEEIEDTKKTIIKQHEMKEEEKIKKQKEEAEEEKDPLKPNIRTRNWKTNKYNRRLEEGNSASDRKRYPQRTYMLRLRQVTGLPALNERKAQALLINCEMDAHKALITVRENLDHYKKYLSL
jgi:hypothetical protein